MYMNYPYKYLLFLLLSFMFAGANSQDLVTDRPDQTESSATVPVKTIQWESGFWFEKDSKSTDITGNQLRSTGINSSLFRYGLFQNFELRLGSNLVRTHNLINRMGLWESMSVQTDLEPVYTGLKFLLTEESGIIPQLAILGHLSLPFLSSINDMEISSDITLAGSYTFSETLGFGFNLGSHWDGSGIDRPNLFYSAVLGISHGEKLGSFWEIYGWESSALNGSDLRADAGLTYKIKPRFQLDFSAGLGLSDHNPDFFISTGFSIRIPQ